MSLHDRRFPGESPEYREARDALLEAEIELDRQRESVAEQRRSLPLGGALAADYEFDEWDPDVGKVRATRLSELFAPGKDSLFLYSFMFRRGDAGRPLEVPCPMCTSIIDAVDGAARHVSHRINFAAIAKAPVEQFAAHARTRGWSHLRLLSSGHSSYNRDYNAESIDGNQSAMATVFVRRSGRIHHFWSSEKWFVPPPPGQHPRHVDFMWPMWEIFDRTPDGRGEDWMPKLKYG